MDSFTKCPAPYGGVSDIWRPSHGASTFDHTDHTGLLSVEPGHIGPPKCTPHAGGRVSSSYLH